MTIDAMRTAAVAMRSGVGPGTARAIRTAQDAVKAECLGDMAQTRSYETDGASSLGMWARNEMRLGAKDAGALVRASTTMNTLPEVGAAALAGLIRIGHVAVFTYGLKHIDSTREYQLRTRR